MSTASLKPSASEIVIGVVCSVGTDYSQLVAAITDRVKSFRYQVNAVRLSEFLHVPHIQKKHGITIPSHNEFDRISRSMDAGDRVRELSGRADILALYAASSVARQRGIQERPRKSVHVLLTLKRPEEVSALRLIYGSGFFLIGAYSSEQTRFAHLTKDLGLKSVRAKQLMKRDAQEEIEFGQKTRATFQLADAFVELDGVNLDRFRESVYRFLDLLFGDPFQTPRKEEHAMFLAYAASLRSADLSRQVGAVVVSAAGEVIATGANDVPAPGGGLYWPGQTDQRDYKLGKDSNKQEIRDIAVQIAQVLSPKASASERDATVATLMKTRLRDLTEFGRPVHAEMEALLHCARNNVSAVGADMYVTTFPCHNCAKHIIAAGIRRVFFVEPYPKSRALDLHKDAIVFERSEGNKVQFQPFVGVAARRYFDLFSLKLSSGQPIQREDHAGLKKKAFRANIASPRIPVPMTSIGDREKIAVKIISDTME